MPNWAVNTRLEKKDIEFICILMYSIKVKNMLLVSTQWKIKKYITLCDQWIFRSIDVLITQSWVLNIYHFHVVDWVLNKDWMNIMPFHRGVFVLQTRELLNQRVNLRINGFCYWLPYCDNLYHFCLFQSLSLIFSWVFRFPKWVVTSLWQFW